MSKLSDLASRTLTPANYRFSSDVFSAVQVQGFMLADNVVDFSVFKDPKYREVIENDLLFPNDVVVGFSPLDPGSEREIVSVGLYHPAFPFAEPVTLAPRTLAYRAYNLFGAVSILAGFIYALDRRRALTLNAIRAMEIALLTDDQVVKFLELLKTAHEMRVNMRKRDALMRELIPATIAKFFSDNKEPEEIKL
jgi:hypothetical protein